MKYYLATLWNAIEFTLIKEEGKSSIMWGLPLKTLNKPQNDSLGNRFWWLNGVSLVLRQETAVFRSIMNGFVQDFICG